MKFDIWKGVVFALFLGRNELGKLKEEQEEGEHLVYKFL